VGPHKHPAGCMAEALQTSEINACREGLYSRLP
jgi:hypothetical protein